MRDYSCELASIVHDDTIRAWRAYRDLQLAFIMVVDYRVTSKSFFAFWKRKRNRCGTEVKKRCKHTS